MGFQIVMRAKGRLWPLMAGNSRGLIDDEHQPIAIKKAGFEMNERRGFNHASRITLLKPAGNRYCQSHEH